MRPTVLRTVLANPQIKRMRMLMSIDCSASEFGLLVVAVAVAERPRVVGFPVPISQNQRTCKMGSAASSSSMPPRENPGSSSSSNPPVNNIAAATLEYQAVMRASLAAGQLRHYCSRPTDILELCRMSAFDDRKHKASWCDEQFLSQVKACNFLLVTQATMLACKNEIQAARSAALPDMKQYEIELERTFVPKLKLKIGTKRLPEPIYNGGSSKHVEKAMAYSSKEFDKGKSPDWNTVAPMLRSDFDKTTGEFRGA